MIATYISVARDTATPLKHQTGPEGRGQETENSEGSDDEDRGQAEQRWWLKKANSGRGEHSHGMLNVRTLPLLGVDSVA